MRTYSFVFHLAFDVTWYALHIMQMQHRLFLSNRYFCCSFFPFEFYGVLQKKKRFGFFQSPAFFSCYSLWFTHAIYRFMFNTSRFEYICNGNAVGVKYYLSIIFFLLLSFQKEALHTNTSCCCYYWSSQRFALFYPPMALWMRSQNNFMFIIQLRYRCFVRL